MRKREKLNRVQTGLRIPQDLYNRLVEKSKDISMSLNQTILFSIREGIDRIDEKVFK